MKQIALILTLLICFSLKSLVSSETVGNCGPQKSEEFDECFARALMVSKNQTFPSRIDQVDILCSEARGNLRCIKSFSDSCLNGMQKQSSSMLAKGVSTNVKNLCKTPNGKKKAMRLSRCAKKFVGELRKIMDDFANDYRDVNEMDSGEKVSGLCCGYHRFLKRLVDQSSKVCNAGGVESLKTYIDNISGDIMNLFCSTYSAESPKCLDIYAKSVNRVPTAGQTATFIPPLLIAVENF